MGQYYKPTLLDENNKVIDKFYSHDYDSGLKLMEHSWLKNDFTGAVATAISDGDKKRVAWLGDYAEHDDLPQIRAMPPEQFDEIMKAAWSDKANRRTPNAINMETGFLVNHSKKLYIDLATYKTRAKMTDGWVVNPLPLLTAVGNGKGGGDYHNRYINFDRVGEWAFDLISYELELPTGLNECDIIFSEDEPKEDK